MKKDQGGRLIVFSRLNGWRLFGFLFLFAGGSKLLDSHGFLESIYAFQLPLPALGAKIVALVLPVFEIVCGALLLMGSCREVAEMSVFSLLCSFTVITGQAWLRGLELSCGCFELEFLGDALLRWVESAGGSFLRNLGLTIACSGLIWWPVVDGNPLPEEKARTES